MARKKTKPTPYQKGSLIRDTTPVFFHITFEHPYYSSLNFPHKYFLKVEAITVTETANNTANGNTIKLGCTLTGIAK